MTGWVGEGNNGFNGSAFFVLFFMNFIFTWDGWMVWGK